MINNPETIPATYSCRKEVADYLIYKEGFSLLSIKDGIYYFKYNKQLHDALQRLPLWLKLLKFFRT